MSQGVPFLRSQNIWNDGLKLDDVAYIDDATHHKMRNTHVLPNDVLLNITGASLGRCALVPSDLIAANVSQHVTIIRPLIPETRRFIQLCLLAPFGQAMIWGRQVGMAREGLSKKVLELFEIPMPGVEEQKRIVEKVDELMKLCDQLESQQSKRAKLLPVLSRASHDRFVENPNAENLQTLFHEPGETIARDCRLSVLALAMQGLIVPQRNSEGKTSDLLAEIDRTQSQTSASRLISPRMLTPLNAPFAIPATWKWCRLSQVTELLTSGSRGWAKYYSNSGAKFLTMGNLSKDNYALRLDLIRYVNPPKSSEGRRTRVQADDILISVTGEVGNLGLVPEDFGEAYINQHTCLLRLHPSCRTRYFAEFLRSSYAKQQFNEPQRGIKNSFRLSDVSEMLVPIPPVAEQHRIVARIDQLMALVDKLEAKQHTTRQVLELFAQAAVNTITVTESKEQSMKPPLTEIVSKLVIEKKPGKADDAPLAILLGKQKGATSAKDLWQFSGLEIDHFYQQLKTEMAEGWISEPEKAFVKEVEEEVEAS